MPIRPDDPDEPQPGDPAAVPPDDAHDGVPAESKADADGPADGTADADVPDPDDEPIGAKDLDTRFAELVTRLRGAPDPRSWEPGPEVEIEDEDEHFEPPEPEAVLSGDPLLTMAWCAVLGVLLLMVVVAVGWRDVPTIVLQAAGVIFLAGIGLLIWRMPRDNDDDPGPGAVV
jgi:hypothetical protein